MRMGLAAVSCITPPSYDVANNQKGLHIDGVRGEMIIPVKAATPDQLVGPLGAVLIATKSQHAVDALKQVIPLLNPDSCVVSFQNGFNEPDMIAALDKSGLPGDRIVMGSIPNYGGALVDPGHVEFVHEGPIQLGETGWQVHASAFEQLAERRSVL